MYKVCSRPNFYKIMEKQKLTIRLEDELIKKLILKAKEEEIAFEDYLIKTLKKAIIADH